MRKIAYEILALRNGNKKLRFRQRFLSEESALKVLSTFKPSTKIIEIYKIGIDSKGNVFFCNRVNYIYNIDMSTVNYKPKDGRYA